MSINSIKPLDFGGKKLISPEEALKQLEGYEPPEEGDAGEGKEGEGTPPGAEPSQIILPENYPSSIDFSKVRIFPSHDDPSQQYFNFWEGMADLTAKGFVALNFPDVLRWRIWMHQQGKTDIAFEHGYDSSSGALYKKDSDLIKIVHSMRELYQLVSKPTLIEGALDIPDAAYNSYSVNEYSENRVAHDQHQTLDRIIDEQLWLELCGGDKKLLKEYAGIVAGLLKPEKITEFMKVWLGSNDKEKNLGRTWYVYNLDYRSCASGIIRLDSNACFLGYAQETR